MDFITKAIKNKNNFNKIHTLNKQSWEEFEKISSGKKLFLFGVGAGAGFFWKKYQDIMPVYGVIDNDVSKQGQKVGDLLPEASMTQACNIYISNAADIKKHDSDDIVVLITSLNYYEEIVNQLENYGINNVFILLIMEAHDRARHKGRKEDKPDNCLNIKEDYVRHCCQFPIQKNKIVFKSFGTYSDHGKYITEQILKYRQDLDIVWIVNNLSEEVPQGVRLVLANHWKQYIYEMETAHIWIVNTIIQGYLKKREGQIYIHTKHWASITLKKFYLDASTIIDVPEDVALWKYNGKAIDYMITGSKFDEESCRRGFEFHKQFINAGSPRTDAMFHSEEYKEKIYNYYNISSNKQVVLYAPTYRYKKNYELGHYVEARNCELNFEKLKEVLEFRFGGEWYIFLRLHPAVAKESRKIRLPEYVIDTSSYPDSEELCASCEILISDYSSIMFEPAFVKKPVFLLATDKKDYIDKEYDLLINYDTLPFSIAESNEELVNNIKYFDQELYVKKVITFLNDYGVHEDGHASERAAQFILKLIEK